MIILKNIFYYFQMSIFPPRLSFSTNYLAFLNFLIVSKLRHMVDLTVFSLYVCKRLPTLHERELGDKLFVFLCLSAPREGELGEQPPIRRLTSSENRTFARNSDVLNK